MRSSLAIGDFSRATHLSVKALRHYHHLGLLLPEEVDATSGYRRYTADQIVTAQIIRRFRDLSMPLEEIRDVLATPNLPRRNELIARHLARLEHDLALTREAVASLRGLLGPGRAAARIAHRREERLEVAAIADVVELSDLGPWFHGAIGELYANLAAQGVPPAGPPGSVIANAFFSDERGTITVFIPVSSRVRPIGRLVQRSLPEVDLATTVHAGADTDIDRAYGSLAAYVAGHAISVDDSIRERYLVGRHDTLDETQWRTEIGWPIFDLGHGTR